jgi:hypothetical protein
MNSTLSRVSRAKSEIKRKSSFTWSEAAIDIRCRLFLSELDWPWTSLRPSEGWTPVEEVHALNEYSLSNDILCDVCRQFRVAEEGVHQPNGTALVQAASEGCRLCSMILDSFENTLGSMDILLQHDYPIILEHRFFEDTTATLTAGYNDPLLHEDELRYFKAHRQLAIVTEGNSMLLGISVCQHQIDTS